MNLELLGLHIRALRALSRPADAERLTRRLRALAPLAVTEPVPSPLAPRPDLARRTRERPPRTGC